MSLTYIYYNYDGSYSAVIAAAIHSGLINNKKETKTISKLINYANYLNNYKGNLIYIGCDSKGNKIYTIAAKRIPRVVERAILGIANLYSIDSKPNLIDMRKYDIPFFPYFHWTLRNTSISNLFFKIYCKRLLRTFDQIVLEVNKVKEGMKDTGEDII